MACPTFYGKKDYFCEVKISFSYVSSKSWPKTLPLFSSATASSRLNQIKMKKKANFANSYT